MAQSRWLTWPGVALLIVSILGGILVGVTMGPYGAGVSIDGVNYVAAARHLLVGEPYGDWRGAPMVLWPPAYPLALAVGAMLRGQDPSQVAFGFNILLYSLTILLSGLLAFRYLGRTAPLTWLFILIITVAPIHFRWGFPWIASEGFYIFATLLWLVTFNEYLVQPRPRTLVVAGLVVALVATIRYIGVAAIGAAGLALLLGNSGGWVRRLGRAALFSGLSVLPLAVWLVRNRLTSQTWTGTRDPSFTPLVENIRYAFGTVLAWYLPHDVVAANERLLVGILLGVGLAVTTVGVYAFRTRRDLLTTFLQRNGVAVLYVIFYLIFLIGSASTVDYERLSDRYLLPIYILVTYLFFALIHFATLFLVRASARRMVVGVVVVLALLHLGVTTRETSSLVRRSNLEGVSAYNTVIWSNNQAVNYFKSELQAEGTFVYSNVTEMFHYYTGYTNMALTPFKGYNPNSLRDVNALRGQWPPQPSYVVWYSQTRRAYLFTIEELQPIAQWEEIARFPDGIIYRVDKQE